MTGIFGAAAVRAADAMLRTLGGTQVTLLFAGAVLPAGGLSQLGLVDPGVVQATIGPVAGARADHAGDGAAAANRDAGGTGGDGGAGKSEERGVGGCVVRDCAWTWYMTERFFISKDLPWSAWLGWLICIVSRL